MENYFRSKWVIIFAIFIPALVVFLGCSGSSGVKDDPIPNFLGEGQIVGTVTMGGSGGSIIAVGVGVASAEVWLESNKSIKTYTDSNGRFVLSRVPFGKHRVVAKYTSVGKVYKWCSEEVELKVSKLVADTGQITVKEATGTVSGRVLDKNGNPVSNVAIRLWGEVVFTNNDGYFTIRDMPPVVEQISIIPVAFQPATITVNFAEPSKLIETTVVPNNDTNRPPTLSVSASKYFGIQNSESVNLVALASDPDNNLASISWFADRGVIVTVSNMYNARWSAPDTGLGTATIKCVARDLAGLLATVTLYLFYGSEGSIVNATPTTPIVSAPTYATTSAIVTLSAVATDPEGLTLTYIWEQISGLPGTFLGGQTGASVTWQAPASPTTAIVRVRAYDGVNYSQYSQVSINVVSASGGASPTVSIIEPPENTLFNPTENITLRGRAIDPDVGELTAEYAKPKWYYKPISGSNYIEFASSPYSFVKTFPTNMPPGTYEVKLKVVDFEGLEGEASITLRINRTPVVSITAPTNGAVFSASQTISFVGSIVSDEDLDEGLVDTNNLRWFIDGALVGSGLNYATHSSNLVPGNHVVRFSYTDRKGLVGSTTINISVGANASPTINILSPVNGQTYPFLSNLNFTATVTDTEDGEIPNSYIMWQINKNGTWENFMAGTKNFTVATLPDKLLYVRVIASDTKGAVSTSTIMFIIASNTEPVMYITQPPANSWFYPNQSIIISGYGWDNDELAYVSTSTFVWKLDGTQINTGVDSFNYTLPAAFGTHTITLEGKDNLFEGVVQKTGSLTRLIYINATPTVNIITPASGTRFDTDTTIYFTASSNDQNDLNPTVTWFVDGNYVGSGLNYSSSSIASGYHTITCYASDVWGLYSVASIGVFVNRLPVATITVVNPPQYATAPNNIPVYLTSSTQTLRFTANTYDYEYSGSLPEANIEWYLHPNLSVPVNVGSSFINDFGPGSYTLYVVLKDSFYPVYSQYSVATYSYTFNVWYSRVLVSGLNQPTVIDVNNNDVYISVSGSNRIEKYIFDSANSSLSYVTSIGGFGVAPGSFTNLNGLDVNSNRIFTVEGLYPGDQKRLQIFDANTLATIAAQVMTGVSIPATVCSDNNSIMISDVGNNRVYRYSANNYQLIETISSVGSVNLSFPIVRYINNYFYIIDHDNSRILRYEGMSNPLQGLTVYTASRPIDVAANNNYLFALDNDNSRIQIINALNRQIVCEFGTAGNQAGQFASPRSIYILADNLLVVESDLGRIQLIKFGNNTFITQ